MSLPRRIAAIAAIVVTSLAVSTLVASPASANNATPPPVIPRLTGWTGGTGTSSISSASRIVVTSNDANSTGTVALGTGQPSRTLTQVANKVAADVLSVTGLSLPVITSTSSAAGDIVLDLVSDSGLGLEGYELDAGDRITLRGQTTSGVFWASRTLVQELQLDSLNRSIPQGLARDVPGTRIRLLSADVSRRWTPIPELKNIIRQMSWYKMNTLNVHFADAEAFRLDSPDYPGLADPERSYTAAEIADLDAFAAQHHVDLIPGIEMPAHATVISEYFGIGASDGTNPCTDAHSEPWAKVDFMLDLTSTTAVQTARDLISEFAPWFDSPYFHIGGDELHREYANCPRVANYITSETDLTTLGDLEVRFLNDMNDTVRGIGKTTMVYNGWDLTPSPQQDLDTDIVNLVFIGDGTSSALAGYQKIVATVPTQFLVPSNNALRIFPDNAYIYDTWAPPQQLGAGFLVWHDFAFTSQEGFIENNARLPRAVFADRFWNTSTTPDQYTDFVARFNALGFESPGYEPWAPAARVNDGHPSHRYTFDDVDWDPYYGDVYKDNILRLLEDSVGALDGYTYRDDSPTIVPGRFGEAFRLNSGDDGADIGGVDIAPPWSMSVWVNRRGSQTSSTLLGSQDGAIKLEQWSNTGKVGFTKYGVADYAFDYSTPLNTWTNITLAAGSDNVTRLYVNGAFHSSINATIDLPMMSVGTVDEAINGDLDDLVIWDEALSATQIADHVSITPPTRYWRFDERSGNVTKDRVSGTDATISGAAWAGGRRESSALQFDGSNDQVATGVSGLSVPWTIGGWVRRDSARASSVLVADIEAAIKLEQWQNTSSVGTTKYGISDTTSGYTAPLNTWVYLTIVCDGTNTKVYANGSLASTMSVVSGLPLQLIGRSPFNGGSDAAAMTIDELAVFDRAFTPGEVTQLFKMN